MSDEGLAKDDKKKNKKGHSVTFAESLEHSTAIPATKSSAAEAPKGVLKSGKRTGAKKAAAAAAPRKSPLEDKGVWSAVEREMLNRLAVPIQATLIQVESSTKGTLSAHPPLMIIFFELNVCGCSSPLYYLNKVHGCSGYTLCTSVSLSVCAVVFLFYSLPPLSVPVPRSRHA
jgi:hypothetical protein